jgi:hypothetical protein
LVFGILIGHIPFELTTVKVGDRNKTKTVVYHVVADAIVAVAVFEYWLLCYPLPLN